MDVPVNAFIRKGVDAQTRQLLEQIASEKFARLDAPRDAEQH